MTKMFVVGAAIGLLVLPVLARLFKGLTVQVQEREAVLVTRFGKHEVTLDRPGLHFLPAIVLPWVQAIPVSLRRDFRLFRGVHVNDARGTTVIVDLWVEFRIADAARATFSVADWDRSLQNLVVHSVTSILGNREFNQILCDRNDLGRLLQVDIAEEIERWGLAVDQVYIHRISLLPDVSRQLFETIAARLERAKADVEESGRIAVAELDADTDARVAELVADAKAQYPRAIGRALARLQENPAVLEGYEALQRLSLLHPHRTVAFRGFDGGVQAFDEALMPGPDGEDPLLEHGADRRR